MSILSGLYLAMLVDMKTRILIQKIGLVLTLVTTVVFFQNCSPVQFNQPKEGNERIIGECRLSNFGSFTASETYFRVNPANVTFTAPDSLDLEDYLVTFDSNTQDNIQPEIFEEDADLYQNIEHIYRSQNQEGLSHFESLITLQSKDNSTCKREFRITITLDLTKIEVARNCPTLRVNRRVGGPTDIQLRSGDFVVVAYKSNFFPAAFPGQLHCRSDLRYEVRPNAEHSFLPTEILDRNEELRLFLWPEN